MYVVLSYLPTYTSALILACVASVSVWFRSNRKTEERDSRFWPREKCNKRQKMKVEGRGKGRKETLADKPLDFENLRLPGNAAPDWLD